jgi:Fe2+ or Zn2+ uptake regulation protein
MTVEEDILSIKTWRPHPLHMTIIEILKSKGPMTDMELFNTLKESNEEVGFRTLNHELMKMEIGGKIHVSSLTRGKRRVELIKPK